MENRYRQPGTGKRPVARRVEIDKGSDRALKDRRPRAAGASKAGDESVRRLEASQPWLIPEGEPEFSAAEPVEKDVRANVSPALSGKSPTAVPCRNLRGT